MTFTWWIDEPVLKGSANPTDEDLTHLRAQDFTTGDISARRKQATAALQ
jgi:hypothetical protein